MNNLATLKDIITPPHGKWVITSEDTEGIHCIKCLFCKYEKGFEFNPYIKVTFDKLPYYCENCGARMDGRQTMNDLISREALKKAACVKFYTTPYYKHILDLIDNAPTIEPTFGVFKSICCEDCDKNKRPKDKWIMNEEWSDWECPHCGHAFEHRMNFCGYCGADMREEKRDEQTTD